MMIFLYTLAILLAFALTFCLAPGGAMDCRANIGLALAYALALVFFHMGRLSAGY